MENDNLNKIDTNESPNVEQELERMKQQYALLQEELRQQRIADEKLLFEVANSRLAAWQKKQTRAIWLTLAILVASAITITCKDGSSLLGIISAWGILAFISFNFFCQRKAYRRCKTLAEVVETMAYVNSISPEPWKYRLPKAIGAVLLCVIFLAATSDGSDDFFVHTIILFGITIPIGYFAAKRAKKKQDRLFDGIENIINKQQK